MAKVYSSTKTKNGREYNEHSLVYSEGGKRVVRSFADLEDAKREAELAVTRIANGVISGSEFKVADYETYRLAQSELVAFGRVTVLEAVREYRAAVVALGGHGSLLEAAREFAKARSVPQKLIPDVANEMLKAKEADGLSRLHVRDLMIRLRTFAKSFPGPIAEVKTVDLEAYLRRLGLAARSRNNHAGGITTLFRFARRQGYLPPEKPTAADALARAKEVSSDVIIYTPEELRAMLEKLARFRSDLLPFVALGAFAGLRSSEIERLKWEDISFDEGFIKIAASQTKTAQRRIVPVSDNLKAWLEPYRTNKGPVCVIHQQRIQFVVEHAVKDPEGNVISSGLVWKKNALRHSYGSYRIPVVKSAAEVALEMGNSPRMVFQHYREVVSQKQAIEWWGINPAGSDNAHLHENHA